MSGSRTYRTQAVVLDSTKLGETDIIATMLAESGRQVRAVAKGARKPGSRTAARMQRFGTVDALLAQGRNLDVVSQVELVCAPLGPAPHYELMCAASVIAEVARHCSFEDADDPFVFAITTSCLSKIADPSLDGAHLDVLCAAYIYKLLSHLGYRPDVSQCVTCGDEALSYWCAPAGGSLCASCARDVAGAVKVSPVIFEWLQALLALRFDELGHAAIEASTAALLLDFAHQWAATHLDTRIRSLEFLREVFL